MKVIKQLGRGLGSMAKGIGSTEAYKKDRVSWNDVIREARLFNFPPKKISTIINKIFLEEFFKNTDFLTFALCSVYHGRLERLKKIEKPYSAQTYVMQHYPDLVSEDMRTINKGLETATGYKRKVILAQQRSKRNTIRQKYKSILKHPSWELYITKYSKSAHIQKIINSFFVR